MEYGSLSDWVSSLSTLGTFVIAVMAYKAAPNWIKQKSDEYSFSSFNKLFDDAIPKFEERISEICYQLNNKIPDDIYCDGTSLSRLQSYVRNNRDDFNSYDLYKYELDIKFLLEKIERNGWKLNNEANIKLEEFIGMLPNFYSVYLSILLHVESMRLPVRSDNDYANLIEYHKITIHESLDKLKELEKNILSKIKEFSNSAKGFNGFFRKI